MATIIKRIVVPVGLVLLLGALPLTEAFGQGGINVGGGVHVGGGLGGGAWNMPGGQGGVNAGAAGKAAPLNPLQTLLTNPAAGFATMTSQTYAPPSGGQTGYSPYYGAYIAPDPYGGYLKGAAEVINSQGRYLLNVQQAYLMKEDLKRAQLANRRAAYEEWLWERANLPTLEDERQRIAREQLRRSLNDPPLPEIWSGLALNTLLNNAQTMTASKRGGLPNVPLDEEVVGKINLSSGKAGINFGLLKNEGKLNWPLALRDLQPAGESKELRDQIQTLTENSVKKAKEGPVDANTIREIETSVDKLERLLKKNVNDLPFSEYTEGKRYVTQLRDGLKALREPNAADFANGKFKLKGNTVQDLVEYMTKNGLQFAPAVAGEEAAYVALHRALAAFSQAGANLQAER
jgi:hypothetical protein